MHYQVKSISFLLLISWVACQIYIFFFKAINRQPAIDIRLERSDRVELALRNIHRDCQTLNMLIVILPELSGSYGTIFYLQKSFYFTSLSFVLARFV